MRRTGLGDLLVPFGFLGVTAYVLLRFSYDAFPPLHYIVSLPLVVLAAAEFLLARRVRAAVRHEPHARAMEAIAIARCVALGKASSLVAAGVAGAAAGLLARVIPDAGSVHVAAGDTRSGAVLLGAAIALTAAGLVLERAGIDPGSRNTAVGQATRT